MGLLNVKITLTTNRAITTHSKEEEQKKKKKNLFCYQGSFMSGAYHIVLELLQPQGSPQLASARTPESVSQDSNGNTKELTIVDPWASEAIIKRNIFLDDYPTSEKHPEPLAVSSQEDYRFTAQTITNIDNKMGSAAISGEALRAKFMGYGVIRLFKENGEKEQQQQQQPGEVEIESDDKTVAIVAVPNYFSATDLLAFLGEGVIKQVSHLRLIRSENPNRFMVLMKFRVSENAREFQEKFNGHPFNSMEPETCHVIFIKSIIFKPLNATSQLGIPYLLEDPFTLQVHQRQDLQDHEIAKNSKYIKELPTCPVCLERMDSDVTGLVTISCQHTFHCHCLTKWRDDTCPVCRYSNLTPSKLKLQNLQENRCMSCGKIENLWICLICGNIGCGRYNSKHAIQHYENTMHCFAMDLRTQRVWDYAADNYVHRLLQNESDGKLVELPSCSRDHAKDKSVEYGVEYSNILLSQLESQREYYESRLAEGADITMKLEQKVEALVQESRKQNKMKGQEQEQSSQLEEMRKSIAQLQLNHQSVEEKYAKSLKEANKSTKAIEKKLQEEQLLSSGLLSKIETLSNENKELKLQNEELNSQVKDFMFHLQTQEKFKDASEEEKNGTVTVQQRQRVSRGNKPTKSHRR